MRIPSGVLSLAIFGFVAYLLIAWQPIGLSGRSFGPAGGRQGGLQPGTLLWWGSLGAMTVVGGVCAAGALRPKNPMDEH